MEPSAKIILDSVSPYGDRLTTIEATIHRFVLAELNTHRSHSRNSASSRAIPVAKQLQRVREDPAIPLVWPAERAGMQGGDELPPLERGLAKAIWLDARDMAIEYAERLSSIGVHKSVTNRLLEPFMSHKVILSATDAGWDNFWGLRCNPLAQPEMRAAAEAMQAAYDASTPTELAWGAWHLPYIQDDERGLSVETLKKISAGRCARVSYLTHDGVRDHSKDIELCDRLSSSVPPHASPLEHVATQCRCEFGEHQGNFVGWDQFRHKAMC